MVTNIDETFFELSNTDRLIIFEKLQTSANITTISNEVGIRIQQVSRHIQRLMKVGLIKKNPSNEYYLTNFGWIVLRLLKYINFISGNKQYLENYLIQDIPLTSLLTLDVFQDINFQDNAIDFLKFISDNMKNAEVFIWLCVDKIPYISLEQLISAPSKGIQVHLIMEDKDEEPNIAFDPIFFNRSDQNQARVELRDIECCLSYIYVSDAGCAVSFRTEKGFDYRGFYSIDSNAIEWSKELFLEYWHVAHRYHNINRKSQKNSMDYFLKSEVVFGSEDPEVDVRAIQYAVNNFNKVILKGRFNLGTANIIVNKSVVIKGEGRTNDIPDTKIYKKNWIFPFTEQEFLFNIGGDKIDVVIENIHFENFNGTCINTRKGNSFVARQNRFTLLSSLGRGLSFGKWGDHIVGLTMGGDSHDSSFPGGIIVENNYMDFGLSYTRGGFLDFDGSQSLPDYRPDLMNHEMGICVGINITRNAGKVIVQNNIIRNMNSRGILIFDNWNSAEILIKGNTVESDVFGAYPYNSLIAGAGIFAQSAWSLPRMGGTVIIEENNICLRKVNYSGIVVHGPAMYENGAGKLTECIVKNNDIIVEDGLFGVQIRKTDNTLVEGNTISGNSYYGIQISGAEQRNGIDLISRNNVCRANNLNNLMIKPPDEYSDNNIGTNYFAGAHKLAGFEESDTAHIWLCTHSQNNTVIIGKDEKLIDHGDNNKIVYLNT